MSLLPKIAIVGRPNVGKSTVFNRFAGRRHAIIAQEAGTTRDRISRKLKLSGQELILIDSGGIQEKEKFSIEANVQTQAKLAIQEADIIIFVIDITKNFTADDFKVADILRKSKKTTILVANKSDNAEREMYAYNAYELGFGEPITISAIHNTGIDKLKKAMVKELEKLNIEKQKKLGENEEKNKVANICILGRPNAGKSSLINAILGQDDRLIVSDIPGTTRDAIDIEFSHHDKNYNLIDTAGIRRPGKRTGIEKFSIMRCFDAIDRSDIVVLLIDGTVRISNQDCHIAQYTLEAEKGLILAINKIDTIEKVQAFKDQMALVLRRKFVFVPWVPVVFMSAKNKTNIFEILPLADAIMEERQKTIKTNEFNDFMKIITQRHVPTGKQKPPKFVYGSQVGIEPPKFVLFFKNMKNLHFSYPRYIENEIRKKYGFTGTPIHLKLREKVGKEKTTK